MNLQIIAITVLAFVGVLGIAYVLLFPTLSGEARVEKRRKAAKQAREDAPKATCPKCNIVLPAMANGHCYYCDE